MGGIIGLADNIDKGYVRGCVNNSPKIDNKISDSTGGIIGRLNQFDCATCENLINYGEISGTNYTGGIIGDIHEEGKAKNFYLKMQSTWARSPEPVKWEAAWATIGPAAF